MSALAVVDEHRTRGHRIVFTNGCFDVLHRGHGTYLRQARALGDGWRVPLPFPGATDRNTDVLLKTAAQPLRVGNPAAAPLARTYILCTEKPDLPLFRHFTTAAARAQAEHHREGGCRDVNEITPGNRLFHRYRHDQQVLLSSAAQERESNPIVRTLAALRVSSRAPLSRAALWHYRAHHVQ